VEEARACALLVEELGLTREEIGRRVGRSRVAVSNLLRLLDLPDEALDMLAAGDLTEGHGRAILMAGNHDDRRRLARAALAEGWNVRRTEAEARALSESAGDEGPVRAARRTVHPDQEAAASRLGEAFGRALGADVRVTPRGTGYKVALTFDSLDEALELASRIGTAEPV
jgi:ParB family chromosome partitioning protein